MSLSLRLKIFVAQTITAEWVGRLLRAFFRDRISFRGIPIASCNAYVSPSVSAQLFWGIYEGAERRFVLSRLSSDLPVIELGSSIGGVSSHIAKKLDPGQSLICVEANPHLLPTLQQNLSVNASHLDANVIHAAVSSETGSVRFAVSVSSLSSRIGQRGDSLETISAPSCTLSNLVAESGFEGYQLVMDIEGAEASIVFDDAVALSGCERIVAELHETEYAGQRKTVQELLDAFRDCGFALRDRHGPVVVLEREAAAT